MNRRNGLELHAARVLLILHAFRNIDGLTKIAKLDFLVRYPAYLERVAVKLGKTVAPQARPSKEEEVAVESRMVRYKYGPWDDRYFPIVGMLIGLGLAKPIDGKGSVALEITRAGDSLAAQLALLDDWQSTHARCNYLAEEFNLSGSALKDLIYSHLPDAIDRPWRVEI